MDSRTRLLYWLLSASRGGPTRAKILAKLKKHPLNMRKLSIELGYDYKTVQGHVELLSENGILDVQGKRYGAIYFISPEWEGNEYLKELIGDNNDGRKKRS